MDSKIIVAICIAGLLSGCPMDTGQAQYHLTLSVTDQPVDDRYKVNGSVNLGGNPPTNITYHGVKVILRDNSTEVGEQSVGKITTDKYSQRFTATVDARPTKVLIKFDKVTGADGPGTIEGFQWNEDR